MFPCIWGGFFVLFSLLCFAFVERSFGLELRGRDGGDAVSTQI